MYCLPVLKRETHRLDLVKAATSGNPKFFLGTDTAPHAREAKISACGEAHACDAFVFVRLYYVWCPGLLHTRYVTALISCHDPSD